MSLYRVTWEIDIDAESPREAAETAKEIQLIPFESGNSASIFEIKRWPNGEKTTVDLIS